MKTLDIRFAVGTLFTFFVAALGWAQEALPMEPGIGEPGTGEIGTGGIPTNVAECKDTIKISSSTALLDFAELVNGTIGGTICGELTDDVVMVEGAEWTPMNVKSDVKVVSVLGKDVNTRIDLKVVFNGNGHTISGLKFNDVTQDNVGFFGLVQGKLTISNLGIVNSEFNGRNSVGGLVGLNEGTLSITNSYNAGAVSGNGDDVGGLVGLNEGTLSITNSYNAGDVNGNGDYVGGLVGIHVGGLVGGGF
ncbi:GLUG motif-containing protein [Fibrobacter sp.]|uniref:GLUG motif-containing protein n=1 Tax=Fibrobacter sp. TaxID=35828 RepID=UPI00389015ED